MKSTTSLHFYIGLRRILPSTTVHLQSMLAPQKASRVGKSCFGCFGRIECSPSDALPPPRSLSLSLSLSFSPPSDYCRLTSDAIELCLGAGTLPLPTVQYSTWFAFTN
jgi:hypothetical protein